MEAKKDVFADFKTLSTAANHYNLIRAVRPQYLYFSFLGFALIVYFLPEPGRVFKVPIHTYLPVVLSILFTLSSVSMVVRPRPWLWKTGAVLLVLAGFAIIGFFDEGSSHSSDTPCGFLVLILPMVLVPMIFLFRKFWHFPPEAYESQPRAFLKALKIQIKMMKMANAAVDDQILALYRKKGLSYVGWKGEILGDFVIFLEMDRKETLYAGHKTEMRLENLAYSEATHRYTGRLHLNNRFIDFRADKLSTERLHQWLTGATLPIG